METAKGFKVGDRVRVGKGSKLVYEITEISDPATPTGGIHLRAATNRHLPAHLRERVCTNDASLVRS